jgi:hypothetical protein
MKSAKLVSPFAAPAPAADPAKDNSAPSEYCGEARGGIWTAKAFP